MLFTTDRINTLKNEHFTTKCGFSSEDEKMFHLYAIGEVQAICLCYIYPSVNEVRHVMLLFCILGLHS